MHLCSVQLRLRLVWFGFVLGFVFFFLLLLFLDDKTGTVKTRII